ncbi:unnamed protein product, partial [marine sediment metagenome]
KSYNMYFPAHKGIFCLDADREVSGSRRTPEFHEILYPLQIDLQPEISAHLKEYGELLQLELHA